MKREKNKQPIQNQPETLDKGQKPYVTHAEAAPSVWGKFAAFYRKNRHSLVAAGGSAVILIAVVLSGFLLSDSKQPATAGYPGDQAALENVPAPNEGVSNEPSPETQPLQTDSVSSVSESTAPSSPITKDTISENTTVTQQTYSSTSAPATEATDPIATTTPPDPVKIENTDSRYRLVLNREHMYYDAQKDELIDLNQRILGEQYREEEIFGEFCKFVEKKLPGFTSNPQNLANLQDMFRQDYNLFEMGYEASQINSLIDAYTEFLDSPFGTTYGRIRVFYFHQDAGLCIYGYRDYIGNGSSVYLYDVEKQEKTPLISNYLLLDFLSSAPTFNRDNSLMFVTFPKFEGFSCYNNGSGDETCVGNYEGEEVFMVYLDGSQTIKLSNYHYACSQIYISSDEKFAYYKLYKEDKKNLLIPGARQENNTMQTAPDQDTDTWVFCSLEEPGRTFMATGNVIRFEQEDDIVVLEQNGIQHEYATDTGSRLN